MKAKGRELGTKLRPFLFKLSQVCVGPFYLCRKMDLFLWLSHTHTHTTIHIFGSIQRKFLYSVASPLIVLISLPQMYCLAFPVTFYCLWVIVQYWHYIYWFMEPTKALGWDRKCIRSLILYLCEKGEELYEECQVHVQSQRPRCALGYKAIGFPGTVNVPLIVKI